MPRNYAKETEARVSFIKQMLVDAHADGIVYGNSGGKDCTLVAILCKMACANTVGIILPCGSKRNFGEDKAHAEMAAAQFDIETRLVDLSAAQETLLTALDGQINLSAAGRTNIAPRLRMITVYAVAASENRLVAGTGNRSERHMGYFTKWGDGACDFNPIADLTVTEVYEFLRYLNAPAAIIGKAPSAGLFEGQTDEQEMGVTYASIDAYLLHGQTDAHDTEIIDRYHRTSAHKRVMPRLFGQNT